MFRRFVVVPGIVLAVWCWCASSAAGTPHVGYIYKLEGYWNGQPVTYIGSAASIKTRLRLGHQWSFLLKQKSTKISIKKVQAELDIAASKGKNLESARREALRSVERFELDKAEKQTETKNRKRKPGQKRFKVLNDDAIARDPHTWQKRHKVTISRRWRVLRVPGAPLVLRSVGGILLIVEVVRVYYEYKRSRFVMGAYLLEDERGVFALDYSKSSWLADTKYFKTYVSGAAKGQKVQVSKSEFSALADEARALWGTLDGDGDFVPGLLRPSLEVVVDRA